MPKRTNKRNKRKTPRRGTNPAVYILILLFGVAIIWLVSTYEGKKDSKEPAYLNSREDFDLEATAGQIALKLGIPADELTPRETRDGYLLSIPVDRRNMDLTFANMIVKGEFENYGARITSGKAESNQQILTFAAAGQNIELRLHYAKTKPSKIGGNKHIAIVVDDFGQIGGDLLRGFLDLPPEITFAIFSGMTNSVHTMDMAYQQGRETLVHVPMEPIGYPRVNPGENPILIQMSASEVEKCLEQHLKDMRHCIGINNHMGSLATSDSDIMGYVVEVLKKKGLIFLDSRTTNVSVAYQVAQKAHLTTYQNDVFLDSPDISQSTLETKIARVKALGGSGKDVIAITHCHSREKLEYLQTFIRRIEASGFVLIPLSRVGKYDVPLIL